MEKLLLIFAIFSFSLVNAQKLGDSKFKIQLEEKNTLIEDDGFSINSDRYDYSMTYMVMQGGHYIYYYMKDGKCTGIEENIIADNIQEAYKLYKNILSMNNFGIKIFEKENYTCFRTPKGKLQVIIEEGYNGKWYVMIKKGFNATWSSTTGC